MILKPEKKNQNKYKINVVGEGLAPPAILKPTADLLSALILKYK